MSRVQYSEDDHRKAFELYKEFKSIETVSRMMEVGRLTITNWMRDDYRCATSCPFHGWHKLMQLENSQTLQNMDITGELVAVPIPFAKQTRIAETVKQKDAIARITRADLSRLADLEYLYNKMFFHLTGIPLACPAAIDGKSGQPKSLEELSLAYENGQFPKSAESSLRCLMQLFGKIQSIKHDMGLYANKGMPKDEETNESDEEEMTIAKARELKALLENTPPDKLALIQDYMESERRVIDEMTPEDEPEDDSETEPEDT